MSIEENKRLATEFLSRLSGNDVEGAVSMLADDAQWWIAGTPEQVPGAGAHDKQQIGLLLGRMFSQLKDGLRMTVKGMIAEGDKVAVEMESYGELRNGRIYNNRYHMLLRAEDGKIIEVREYLDTHHVVATWAQG